MLGRLKLKPPTALLAVTISSAVLAGGLPRAAATTAHAVDPNPSKNAPSCASCPSSARGVKAGGPEALATLGRRTQPAPLLPVQRSAAEGARVGLVGTAAGDLAFAVKDLELRGATPVFFQRVYTSDGGRDVGLGAGWSFVFDDRITVEGDSALLRTGSGGEFAFARAGGGRFAAKAGVPTLHQSFELAGDGDTIEEHSAGLTRTYAKVGGAYRLARVAGPGGDALAVSFDARGNVVRVAGPGGAALSLRWSAGADARLLSVADSAGRRVSFRQDARRLRSVTDASGARWSYDYDASGRMARASDPEGRALLRASYDARGRAAVAGDAAGSYQFEYDGAPVSRRTVVTDPVGARVAFLHNARGEVESAWDAEGRLLAAEYDAAGRPVSVTDAAGAETSYAYDAEGRLLRRLTAGGAERSYTYDGAGRISSLADGGARAELTRDARGNVSAVAAGGNVSAVAAGGNVALLNARGQVASLKSGNRLVASFEYDARGNEAAADYGGAGRVETEYDAAGRAVARRAPSGLAYSYEYDALGRLVGRRDNRGHSLKIERDAGGAVSAVSGEGRWVRAERDEAGRVVALANSEGQTRRFAYDARGALTDYVDARGARRSFEYDARGRVRSMTGAGGALTRFAYDRAGRLASVTRAGEAASSAARFVPAGYGATARPAQGDFGCMFDGGGDGWFAGDTWEQTYGAGCWDLGGFGEVEEDDGMMTDVNPETCWQCKVRYKGVCGAEWNAKYQRALGTDTTMTVGCALITAGSLALACAAAAGIAAILQVTAANEEYEACMLRIPETCSSSCKA